MLVETYFNAVLASLSESDFDKSARFSQQAVCGHLNKKETGFFMPNYLLH
jgi:hypothetical protein